MGTTRPNTIITAARSVARAHADGLLSWRRWARRTTWTVRTQLRARLAGADLDLVVDPTAEIALSVDVRCRPGTANRLVVGAGARLDEGVFVRFAGGAITVGPECELRQRVVLNVAGDLVLEGGNILSWGTTVHCAEQVVLEALTSASEYVTVTDSRHFHTADGAFFYHNTESAPVRIGTNTWLATKATVLMGTNLGAGSIVAAHAVVGGHIEPDSLVVGAPGRRVRAAARADRDAEVSA